MKQNKSVLYKTPSSNIIPCLLDIFTFCIIGLRNLFYQKVGRLYKNMGILLGWCLTAKNQWELLTGDDGAEMLISTFRWRKSPSIENGKLYYKKDNTYENYFNSKYFSFCHTSLFQIKYQQM